MDVRKRIKEDRFVLADMHGDGVHFDMKVAALLKNKHLNRKPEQITLSSRM